MVAIAAPEIAAPEVDVQTAVTLSKPTAVSGGVVHIFPGESLKQALPGKDSPSPSSCGRTLSHADAFSRCADQRCRSAI